MIGQYPLTIIPVNRMRYELSRPDISTGYDLEKTREVVSHKSKESGLLTFILYFQNPNRFIAPIN